MKKDKDAEQPAAAAAKDNPSDEELRVPMRQIMTLPNGLSIMRDFVTKYGAATPEGAEFPTDPEVRLAYLDDLWKATDAKPPKAKAEKPAAATPPASKSVPASSSEEHNPIPQSPEFEACRLAIMEAPDFITVMEARAVAGRDTSFSILQQDDFDRVMNERLAAFRKARAAAKA